MCQAKPRRQREGLTTQRTQLPKTRHMCVHERVRTHTLTHTPWEGSTSFIGAFGFRGHAIKTSCWERKRLCVLGWGAGMREQLQFLQDKGQARSVPPLPWGRKVRPKGLQLPQGLPDHRRTCNVSLEIIFARYTTGRVNYEMKRGKDTEDWR